MPNEFRPLIAKINLAELSVLVSSTHRSNAAELAWQLKHLDHRRPQWPTAEKCSVENNNYLAYQLPGQPDSGQI